MTFTYTISTTPDNLTLARYHTGDTDDATAMWQDDEINMVLAVEGSVAAAVISLIKSAITKLAREPDMTADWLKIDWRRSADNWTALLAEKRREVGLGLFSFDGGGQHAYRPDSDQHETPDYDADAEA